MVAGVVLVILSALLNFLEFRVSLILILSPCYAVMCLPITSVTEQGLGSFCGLLFIFFCKNSTLSPSWILCRQAFFFGFYSVFVVALLRRFTARDLAKELVLCALAT